MVQGGKFNGVGLVKPEALMARVRNRDTAKALAKKANYGLAANTKESYQTAVNHLKRCEDETGADMSLPFNETKPGSFLVGWKLED